MSDWGALSTVRRLTRGGHASENRWKTCLRCRTWRAERLGGALNRGEKVSGAGGKQTHVLKTCSEVCQSLAHVLLPAPGFWFLSWLSLSRLIHLSYACIKYFLGRPQPHETANSPAHVHWRGDQCGRPLPAVSEGSTASQPLRR